MLKQVMAKSKTHLNNHGSYKLICHPDIKVDRELVKKTLEEEISNLPKDSIIAPILFAPDKTIYFAGGDFLPYTHLPMPWKDHQLWIGQVPEVQEVGFIPLHCFLIPEHLVKILKPKEFYGDNIVEHGELVMRAKQLGVKCYVTPNCHVVWPHAYKPIIGSKKFEKKIRTSLKAFRHKWGKILDTRYRLPVVLHTIITFGGGYNLHAENVAVGLFKKRIRTYYMFIGGTNEDEGSSDCSFVDDYKTRYPSMRYPQITICHGTNNFKNSGDYKIAFTTTEVSGIPGDWVKCLNEMDEVWATSEYAKKSFVKSGVIKPVYVIGEGVDPDFFNPGIAPFEKPPPEKFRFFSNFAWGKRKGVDVLFKAFRQEFDKKEDVSLMVKTLKSYHGHNIKDELKLVYQRKNAAKVHVYDIEVQKYELGRLYNMANVFVWPSRGEGYGLPALEALACGMPVIASNHSAHLEFLLKDGKPRPGVLLLDGKVEPYDKGDSLYYPGFDWFNPSVKHLRELMRYAKDNYKELKLAALKSSEDVRKEFDWSISTQKIVERLEAIYSQKWGKYGDSFSKD